jgi:hypothetical protein
MKSITEIEKRLKSTVGSIGHDMAPPIVNATRVAYAQALNWVLDNPIDEKQLDAAWHEFAGITTREI